MAKTSDVAADAAVPSSADIERAAAFAREPFLLDGEGPEALAPGTARRRALDAALKELEEGAENPSLAVAPRLLPATRTGALPRRRAAEASRRGRTEPAPGRCPLRDAGRADGPAADRDRGPGDRERQRRGARCRDRCRRRRRRRGRPRRGAAGLGGTARRGGRGGGRGGPRGPGRRPSLLVRARDRRRQDRRRRRLHRGDQDRRRPDPHPPSQPRRPVHRRDLRPRLQGATAPTADGRPRRPRRPGHGRDLPVVRPQPQENLRRLLDRHLRRGAHRPRRENQRLHPRSGPARSTSA